MPYYLGSTGNWTSKCINNIAQKTIFDLQTERGGPHRMIKHLPSPYWIGCLWSALLLLSSQLCHTLRCTAGWETFWCYNTALLFSLITSSHIMFWNFLLPPPDLKIPSAADFLLLWNIFANITHSPSQKKQKTKTNHVSFGRFMFISENEFFSFFLLTFTLWRKSLCWFARWT